MNTVSGHRISFGYVGMEEPGRPEKIALNLPRRHPDRVGLPKTPLCRRCWSGARSTIIGRRAPSCFERGDRNSPGFSRIRRAPRPSISARPGYSRSCMSSAFAGTLRRSIPGCRSPSSKQAKTVALAKLVDTSATKVTLPFVEEQLRAARQLIGTGLLVLRRRAHPPCASELPASPPPAGPVAAAARGRRAVPPSTFETHKI